jgi:hypothetical protein
MSYDGISSVRLSTDQIALIPKLELEALTEIQSENPPTTDTGDDLAVTVRSPRCP